MVVERPPRAIWLMLRIKMEHYPGDFAPVRTFRIRVKQAQIRDDVLLVISDQNGIGGRDIRNVGIERRRSPSFSRASA
jgi:hypothetical protein